MSPATAAENIEWIIRYWPNFMDSRLIGTPRPWKQPTISPERQAELDAEARDEKLEHGAFVLGESEAPLHLDVLDKAHTLARRIQDVALELSDQIGSNLARHQYPDMVPLLWYINGHMGKAGNELWNKIRRETADVRAVIAGHFGSVYNGQRLKTECPWCCKEQLFIRLIGPEHDTQPVVVCESGVCEPEDADCGKSYRGNPCWPFYEWEWLANRLNYEDERKAS